VWSAAAVRAGIADGVAKGFFAYAIGVSGEGADVRVENARLIQLGVPLDANEVDIGPSAALLSPEVAERLRAPETPAPSSETEPGLPPSPFADPADSADTTSVGPPPPGVSGHARVQMNISAKAGDLTSLDRALRGLREVVGQGGELRVSVAVDASRADTLIDQVQFQNRVRQHLEEDGVHFEERWE